MKLVAAYNGTIESKTALELAKKHAKLFNATLLVISSSEGGKTEDPELIGKIQMDLKQIKKDKTASCQKNFIYFFRFN